MTIPTDTPRREFVEDGVTTVHPIAFKFIDASDITVYRIPAGGGDEDAVLLTQPAGYTVQGGGYAIGQITKANGGTAGATLRIDRNTAIIQPLDYIQGDDFSAESHEHGLDRLTMIAQELKRDMLDADDVREIVAAFLKAGAGIDLDLNAEGDELTIINTYDAEFIRDTIGAALLQGTGINIIVDDEANTITIAGTGGMIGSLADFVMLSGDQQNGGDAGTGAGTFAEQVRDIMFATLVGVGINITADDEANTITLTNTVNAEFIRDTIGAALVEAAGIDITVNDAGDTISVAVTGGGGGVTLEEVRDMLATCLSPGTLINIVPNDAGDVIVISSTALDPTYKGLVPSSQSGSFNFADSHNGRALNLTGSASSGTLQPQGTVALSSGWAVVVRNNGSGVKTIARGAGVTLKKNGSNTSADAAIAVGGTATIQRWGADDFTISGPGVS